MAAKSVQLLSIDARDLADFRGRLSKADVVLISELTKGLKRYGQHFVAEAKREAPVRTGKLQDSIRYAVTGQDTKDVQLRVFAGNKDRPDVVVNTILYGSKPHIIRPRPENKSGLLVFQSYHGSQFQKRGKIGHVKLKSNLVFTPLVHHPGTRPNNFFERAFNHTQDMLDMLLKRIGKLTVDMISER